jgi:hypothetical protein
MTSEQPTLDLPRAEYANEETVLDLLLGDERQRPWTLHELALDIGSQAIAEDAIDNLHAAGLVHKTSDGFIFASRPAIRYHQITE